VLPVGKSKEEWNPRIVAVYDRFPVSHDILGPSQCLIVSPRFGNLLNEMVEEQIQLFPLRLISPDGKVECEGFSLLNVLQRIPMCDLPSYPNTPLIFYTTWGGIHLRISKDILERAINEGINAFDVISED